MGGIYLGQHQAGEGRAGAQLAQDRHGRGKGHPFAVVWVVRRRQVGRVDGVDVEMHQDGVGGGFDVLARSRGGTGGIGGKLGTVDVAERRGEQVLFSRVDVGVVVAEDR